VDLSVSSLQRGVAPRPDQPGAAQQLAARRRRGAAGADQCARDLALTAALAPRPCPCRTSRTPPAPGTCTARTTTSATTACRCLARRRAAQRGARERAVQQFLTYRNAAGDLHRPRPRRSAPNSAAPLRLLACCPFSPLPSPLLAVRVLLPRGRPVVSPPGHAQLPGCRRRRGHHRVWHQGAARARQRTGVGGGGLRPGAEWQPRPPPDAAAAGKAGAKRGRRQAGKAGAKRGRRQAGRGGAWRGGGRGGGGLALTPAAAPSPYPSVM
jgi:hypothetical protein